MGSEMCIRDSWYFIHILFLAVLVPILISCSNAQIASNRSDETVIAKHEPAAIRVNVGIVQGARDSKLLTEVQSGVNNIYQQCNLSVSFDTHVVDLEEDRGIDREARIELAERQDKKVPNIFYVTQTTEQDVAFAYLPSLNSSLSSTIWITDRVNEKCLAWITAHEIGHVLLNSALHSNGSKNVMSTGCKVGNWSNSFVNPRWTPAQCVALHQSPFITRQNSNSES